MKTRFVIDKILTFVCLFIPFYLVCHFISTNVGVKIVLAALFSMLGLLGISLFQKINKSKVNYKNFELYVSVKGTDYIYDKLIKVFENLNFVRKDNYLISESKIMIICSVKFGSVSPDEILKYSKIAQDNNVEKCYLIAKELPKNAALTLFNFAENVKFVPLKIVFKLLKAHKLLPDKLNIKIGKLSYSKNIFDIIFDISNLKKFLFVAIVLFAFSFLIPFKTYYIILGSVNILLAIICIIRGRTQKYSGRYEIFERTNKNFDKSN